MARTSRVWKKALVAISAIALVTACSTSTNSGEADEPSVDEVTSDIRADDSVDGAGAEAFLAAVEASQDQPLKAEGDPFVISMPNLEGDPAGSFPQAREGAEAAVELINNQLGGIGADYESGTPGRPVELKVCSHAVTQQSAQNCGNKIVGQNPDLVVFGIDFFTPLYYPLFEDIPMLHQLPLYPEDYTHPNVYSGVGGCPADMGGVQYVADVKDADKAAIIWVNNATKEGCFTYTEERAAQYYKNQGGFDFKDFPDLPGDPSDNAANIQGVANYLEDADNPFVFFAIQASDCVNYIKGLRAAGVDAQIVSAAACVDPTVLELPETEGVHFQFQSYDEAMEDLSAFVKWELDAREGFIEQSNPENPVATFTKDSFSTIMFAWQVANQVAADGGDPSDTAALQAALAAVNNFHFIGRPPLNCADSPSEYSSICYRLSTYLQWDGSKFVPEGALNGSFMDITELMESVEAELPLGG
jgi:branched-chain amino acid transport system substrate-binding protein